MKRVLILIFVLAAFVAVSCKSSTASVNDSTTTDTVKVDTTAVK